MYKKMTPHERIIGCIQRNPDWPDWRIAKSADVHVNDVRAIKSGTAIAPPPENAGLISLEKVINHYDIKTAIKRELLALPRGQLIIESELCIKAAGSDRNRFRRTVENNADEFRAYRVKLKLDDSSDGKWYWGNPEDIAEAQRIRDL